jgi:ubiquitin-protein ligase E3 C
MFNNFSGEFRRLPIQNLGGTRIETDRQTLIKKAQDERKKREEIRKKEISAQKIKNWIRFSALIFFFVNSS